MLRFEIVGGSIWVFIIVDVLSHLPHLQDVVLRHTAYHPGLIRVPGKVRDLGCVPSMDKLKMGGYQKHSMPSSVYHCTHHKLWRAIFSILWRLLLSNLAQVPDMESPVRATGCQNGLIVGRPLHLEMPLCKSTTEPLEFYLPI